MSGPGHNSEGTSFAQGQLRSLVDRIERLDEENKAISADRKEVYAEAKASGFDTKVLKKVIAMRRRDAAERQEEEAIIDLYMSALGMLPGDAGDGSDEQTDAEAPGQSVNDGDDVSTHAGAEAGITCAPADPSCKPGEPSALASDVTGEACAPSNNPDPAAVDSNRLSPLAAAGQAAGGVYAPPAATPVSADPPDAGEIPEFLRRAK